MSHPSQDGKHLDGIICSERCGFVFLGWSHDALNEGNLAVLRGEVVISIILTRVLSRRHPQ